MSFNAIRENEILAKIFESTVTVAERLLTITILVNLVQRTRP